MGLFSAHATRVGLQTTAVALALLHSRSHTDMAANETMQLHSVLRVQKSGSIVLLQPFKGQDVAGETLSIDLHTGSIELAKVRTAGAQDCAN